MSKNPDLDRHFRDPAVPLTAEQRDLRKRVLKEIENEPDLLDMSTWESVRTGYARDQRGQLLATCETTRCLAGWAQFLARGKVTYGNERGPDVEPDAIGLLGLTEAEFYQDSNANGEGLFYLDDDEAVKRMRELAEDQ